MSKMTYRKIEEKPSVTINKKKKDLQFIGISPTGEAVFCTNILSVEDLISLGAQSYNYNDAYFPFNVVLKNDLDLVTSIVLDAIERGDFTPNEEQQLALDRLVDATDGVCYPVLMDRVNRSYPEMIKKYNAEKMCKDIEKAVEEVEDAPDDSKEEDVIQINHDDKEYKVVTPGYANIKPIEEQRVPSDYISAESCKTLGELFQAKQCFKEDGTLNMENVAKYLADKDSETKIKNMTKLADFMEANHVFDENGHIDCCNFIKAFRDNDLINFD